MDDYDRETSRPGDQDPEGALKREGITIKHLLVAIALGQVLVFAGLMYVGYNISGLDLHVDVDTSGIERAIERAAIDPSYFDTSGLERQLSYIDKTLDSMKTTIPSK